MPWNPNKAEILVAMGSESDWEVMQHTAATLDKLDMGYECRIMSAHRTPDRLHSFLEQEALNLGVKVIIAGAGGAAHLAGAFAALTPIPVLAVPIPTTIAGGLDSLLSIVQMPAGVPVATFAIGRAGAVNAALFAAAILAVGGHHECGASLREYRVSQTERVPLRPKACGDAKE